MIFRALSQRKKIHFNLQNVAPRLIFFIVISLLMITVLNANGEPILKFVSESKFQFSRILSLENIWQSPVNFKLYNQTGQMVNLFTPWLFVYPMYLLIIICQNIVIGYYIYFIILTIITLEISYRCILAMTRQTPVAIIFSLLYTFANYRMLDLYYRLDIGEAVSLTFIPVFCLGMYRLFYTDQRSYIVLALGLAGLIYSKLITFYLAMLVLLLMLLIRLFRRKLTKQIWLNLAKSLSITFVLSLAYIGPMLEMYIKVPITGQTEYQLQNTALNLQEFFFNSFNSQWGDLIVKPNIGIIFLLLLIPMVKKFKLWQISYQDLFILTIILLFMCTKLFPWFLFQNSLGIIQYPWRLLGFASFGLALLAADIFQPLVRKYSQVVVIVGLSVLLVLLQNANLDYLSRVQTSESSPTNASLLSLYDEDVYLGDFGYIPKTAADHYFTFTNHFGFINGEANYISGDLSNDGKVLNINLQAEHEGTVKLPVLQYLGETIYHNGQELTAQDIQVTKDGYLKLAASQGENTYTISYHYTLLARLCWFLSGLMLVAIFWISYKRGGLLSHERTNS